ncbi:hypothetical protein P3L10_019829 [Capsicum annuum]
MTDLEVEVKEVANIVEQTIQLRVTEVVLANDETLREKAQERLSNSLQQVAKYIDRIWKESTKIQDKGKHSSKESTVQEFPSSSISILNHNVKEILLSLLRSTKSDTFDMNDEAELANMLQKSLKVRLCFPIENKGSGVLLTTRNTEVARDAGTENLSFQLNLMDPNESWNLFKSVAFANEALPSYLETIGKQIAEKCHGLPLTIAVVAGLLKSKRAIKDWESVEKDVKSFVTNDPDERCSRVLGLSYNHLTSDLKAYIVLCVSVSVCQSLRMHKMQPFKCVTGDYCRYCLYRALLTPVHHQLRDHDNKDLSKRTRSIFSLGLSDSFFMLESDLIHFKLLKVLDLSDTAIYNFPLQILSLIWLRYLSLHCRGNLDIPPEIFRLWNLPTFIVQHSMQKIAVLVTIACPEELWGLMQLRHLKLPKFYLPDCLSGSVDKGRHGDFSNLQTISYLSPCCCTKEVIMGIQNVKELGICDRDETDSDGFLNNLVHLQQLETLSFTCRFHLLPESTKAFPATLKKLMLKGTFLSWSYLDIIAELPNLEVLKLMNHACSGRKWYPNVRGFTRLKLLLIDDNYLLYWKAIDDNFPVLERLMIRSCYHLKEVPIEFADIHSLRLIKLTSCLPELGESAARIQKEQEDLGNNPVDVLISDPLVRSHHNEFDDDDDDEDEDEGDDNEDFDVHAAERDDN